LTHGVDDVFRETSLVKLGKLKTWGIPLQEMPRLNTAQLAP